MVPVLWATATAGREPGGNRVVELLPFEDRHHFVVSLRVDSTAVRQLVEEDEESTRGRRVVEPFVERLLVLHPPQHAHAVGAERRNRPLDPVGAKLLYQEI